MPSTQHPMRRVWYVTLAHTTVDFYMTLFPPLLALFKAHFALSLVQASLLPTVVSVFGAMPQPLMGYLGDRTNRMALAALGVCVSGIFISAVCLAPSALVLALFLFMAALGSSLFHPTGGGLVTTYVPHRSNLAMAIFLTGGPLGMAIAPITGTQIVERYGLGQLWILVFPSLIAAALLFRLSRTEQPGNSAPSQSRINLAHFRTAAMRPLWTLYAISVFRSLVHAVYISFLSFLGEDRGWSIATIGWILSAYLISSTLGRMAGGYIGDRVSPRKLLALSNALSPLIYIGFCSTTAPAALSLLFLAAFTFDTGATTNIVLAQRLLPQNVSTATGMVMGFSWGTAGLLIPLVGILAETTSVAFALACVSSVLLPAAALVAALPAEQQQAYEPAAAAETD